MERVLRWEDPPPSKRAARFPRQRADRWSVLAAELRAEPGRWAVVNESGHQGAGSGMASTIGLGLTVEFTPAGTFEAVSRKVDGITTVYARYVGGVAP